MGRKVNPIAIRMGINKTWDSVWYSDKKGFPKMLSQDLLIEKMVIKAIRDAGIGSVKIHRTANKIEVLAYVARPGVAIGRGGEGIDLLQKDLKKILKQDVELKVREVKKADLSARIVARSIADGIERRQPSKLLIESAKEKIMMSGAKGVRIWASGRINNASQARTIKVSAGSVPAQTLRGDVDYANEVAKTMDAGLMGIKVWIYKGEKLDIDREE
ncbi:MAG: 30S ribosomal protein S3 [Candidatus Dojkabacteria bacterium]